jgi:MFS family permease
VQASLVVGEVVGCLACLFQNKLYHNKAKLTDAPSQSLEISVAESRLYLSILGSFLGLTGGLFWYGWTSNADLPWFLPSIGLALIGFGSMTVMQAIMMYITDAYERYAASASAAICFGENAFAAFLPLAASSMYTNLGYQWASSLLAFIALAMSFAPVILIFKGREIRRRSPFMKRAAYS